MHDDKDRYLPGHPMIVDMENYYDRRPLKRRPAWKVHDRTGKTWKMPDKPKYRSDLPIETEITALNQLGLPSKPGKTQNTTERPKMSMSWWPCQTRNSMSSNTLWDRRRAKKVPAGPDRARPLWQQKGTDGDYKADKRPSIELIQGIEPL